MDNKTDFSDITKILTQGADERIFTDENGRMKYGIAPVNPDMFNRGSCTCSPAKTEDIQTIRNISKNNHNDNDYLKLRDEQAEKIKKMLKLGYNNFEVLFAPSGTDLFYYPLIISKSIKPDKKILNITTCIEELGSGTKFSADARYYADYNQFGEKINKEERILPEEEFESVFISARDNSGEIINPEEKIIEKIKSKNDRSIIINLVYGSKSGIEDNLSLIEKFRNKDIIWSIDLCQFRHDIRVINKLLEMNAMVMITGSKFYQSPPFCAAMLIPEKVYSRFKKSINSDFINKFKNLFSVYDFPKELKPDIKLNNQVNRSLIIRWESAINEMQKYHKLNVNLAEDYINKWNKTIMDELEKYPEFKLMPYQKLSNRTIVSFRLKYKNQFLDHNELKSLHKFIIHQNYDNLNSYKFLFVGQPVAYQDKSFLRLAIGSKDIRNFIENEEENFLLDKKVINIIRTKLNEFKGN